MRNKPIVFNMYCIFFSLIALSFPLQIMLVYDHSPLEVVSIFSKLTIINHVCIALLIINSWLAWKGDAFLKWTLPVLIGFIAFNNWVVSKYGFDFDFNSTTLATILFTVVTSSILFTKGMDILDNPEKRWWLIPKRYQKKLPIYVKTAQEAFLLGKTFDISSTGVFISINETRDHFKGRNDPSILPGETVDIQIPSHGNLDFTCKAKVIRKTQGGGAYPGGLGIQFEDIDLINKYKLYKIMRTSEFSWS